METLGSHAGNNSSPEASVTGTTMSAEQSGFYPNPQGQGRMQEGLINPSSSMPIIPNAAQGYW